MKIYIIGGGPTGLAAANEIGESSESFVLIEKEAQLGGLAKTLEWGKNGFHDLGPHKLFTLDQQLMSRVKNLLEPEQWLTQTKKSSIFMNGHYLPYPPSPFSLAKVYGYFDFFKMVRDYGIAQLLRILPKLSHTVPQHFEEDLHQRVGKSLYQILFYPIALKLWGNPKKLDIKLSQGRVQTPSVLEVAATVLKLNRFQKQNTFEALEFSYPKGGLQQLWEAISEKTKDNGTYHLNHEIQEIEIGKDRVTAIHCENKITKKKRL